MPEPHVQVSGPEEVPKPTPLFEAVVVLSFAVAVLALLLFTWLGHEMLEGDTRRFDDAVRFWVHQFASTGMTRAMTLVSSLGSRVLVAQLAVVLIIFAWLRWRRAAIWLAITMTGALLLEITLKWAYHRPRPVAFFGDLPDSYSFPSGHALTSLCFYGVLAGLLAARIKSLAWRIVLWTVAGLLIIAIGLSRIYLGVHYPSDVLAGYLAATLWVTGIIVLDHVRKVRFSKQK
ncbi:MAG TPA: phosphatase PAP2 family protein [Candidatus Angelobacter sp.]|nr:phosphatase PAP2 family protein [Candidatus Angelobacter sp.]